MIWDDWTPERSMEVTGSKEPLWKTAQLDNIPIGEIGDDHLLEIERMLIGRGGQDPKSREEMFINWYDIMRDEIEKRGLKMIQEDHPRLEMYKG